MSKVAFAALAFVAACSGANAAVIDTVISPTQFVVADGGKRSVIELPGSPVYACGLKPFLEWANRLQGQTIEPGRDGFASVTIDGTPQSVEGLLVRSGWLRPAVLDDDAQAALTERRGGWACASAQAPFDAMRTSVDARILTGIALNESAYNGRAWPWTLNVAGRGFFQIARRRVQSGAFPDLGRPLRFRRRFNANKLVLPRKAFCVAVGCACACDQHSRRRRHSQRKLPQDEVRRQGCRVLPQRESPAGPRVSRALCPASLPTRTRPMKHTLTIIALAMISLSASAASTDPLDFDYQINGNMTERPALVFNDGTNTYLQPRAGQTLKVAGGHAEGPYIVVGGTPKLSATRSVVAVRRHAGQRQTVSRRIGATRPVTCLSGSRASPIALR